MPAPSKPTRYRVTMRGAPLADGSTPLPAVYRADEVDAYVLHVEADCDRLNALLDAEMATTAGLRLDLNTMTNSLMLEVAAKQSAIAEREKLREELCRANLDYTRLADGTEESQEWREMRADRDAAIARAEKAEREHIDTAAALGTTVKEREDLRAQIAYEQERNASNVAMYEAQVDGATSPAGLRRASEALRDCNIWSMDERPLKAAITAALEVKS